MKKLIQRLLDEKVNFKISESNSSITISPDEDNGILIHIHLIDTPYFIAITMTENNYINYGIYTSKGNQFSTSKERKTIKHIIKILKSSIIKGGTIKSKTYILK
jgi:hypothetical protein